MQRFYVIDYVDEEGEQVVKHALMEPEEARQLVEETAKRGISGSVADLSPQEPLPVISEHGTHDE